MESYINFKEVIGISKQTMMTIISNTKLTHDVYEMVLEGNIQGVVTVLIIGAGPTGVCCLLCTLLKNPRNIIVCEKSKDRREFIQKHYPQVMVVEPEDCEAFVKQHSLHGGADVVMEVAGGPDTFQLAWKCARPNAIVTIVAMYDKPQMLPLPDMYGKNLIFKTGGVDGCDCGSLIDIPGKDRYHSSDYPSFPAFKNRRGIRCFREPQGWSHQGGDISWINEGVS